MTYLESSALLKLVHEEAESSTLAEWLAARSDRAIVSSELARIEVLRACRRMNSAAIPVASRLLAQLDLIPLTGELVEDAADVGEPALRSLDAIHLASAPSIRAHLAAFVVYDVRLADAAAATGLAVLAPGV